MKIPFNPSVYEHAAYLIDRSPWEVSRDMELLYQAHKTAFLEYRHSPVIVGIDIYNLEAEAYGARVIEPQERGIPAITQPLVESVEDGLEHLIPFDPRRDGRIAMFIETASRLAEDLPEADVRIPVSGPFSIAVNVRGFNGLLEDIGWYPHKTARFLMQLAENQRSFCMAIRNANLDIAFFESAAAPPLLSPKQFHELELPALRHVLAIAESIFEHPVPCIIGGDTATILEDIIATGTGYVICPAETNQAEFIENSQSHPHVRVRINLDPLVITRGSQEEIAQEIERILALAKTRPNCLLGTGCLPYETPPENVHFIANYVS